MAESNKQSKSKEPKKQVQKMDGNSVSPQKELAGILKQQFPQIFAEGKVNPDKLKQALGEELETNNSQLKTNTGD